MDYAKLSDEELDQALAAASKPAAASDYDNMSDADLDQALAETGRKLGQTPTVQEMHPAFTAEDRFVTKFFHTTPEASLNYLRSRLKDKHPGLELAVDEGTGQIKAKGKDEAEYRVLDPDLDMASTGSVWGDIKRGVGETAMDATDLAGEGISTVGTGLASAAAGLGAGALFTPAAALPAAVAAGGAAGAGIEDLKQRLGQALGIQEGYDVGQTAAGGIGGVAAPLLFGTGGKVAGKLGQMMTGGASGEAAAGIQAAQRGVPGRIFDKAKETVLPWLGEKTSGVPAGRLKALGQGYGKLTAMEADPQAVRNFTKETVKAGRKVFAQAEKTKWSAYQGMLDDVADDLVDVRAARGALEKEIARAEDIAGASGLDTDKSLVARLRTEFNKHFLRDTKQVAPQMTATGVLDAGGNPVMRETLVEETVKAPADTLPVKAAAELERRLAELADLGKGSPGDIKGGFTPNRYVGDPHEDKVVGQAAAAAKHELKAALEAALPEGALAARSQWAETRNMSLEMADMLGKKPKKIMKRLASMGAQGNRADLELLMAADAQHGTKLVDAAQTAGVYNTFAQPSLLPIAAGGATNSLRAVPLGLLGGAVGYGLGRTQGDVGGYMGMLGGGALGGLLGGPAAMRAYIAGTLKTQPFLRGQGPLIKGRGLLYGQHGPLLPGLGSQMLEDQLPNPWRGMGQ